MHTPNILILEDEALIALDVEMTLTDMKAWSVTSIASRADALKWLAENTPGIAIIYIFLRDGECMEVADTLVERGVPFVVHSARRKVTHDSHRIFLKGIWIPKPAVPNDLARTVEAHLSKSRFVAA
ncbi:response regulator [Rhizobium sp. WSM1325]|uniref:response regulator n=1 Tax=Rhizobium sp. WSM1325 TaxID=3444086 RepID=UPI000FF2C26C|nr:response regulator [Rhizobium leguminosarum]RWY67679.1 response regulator [Rhizobium leguminosarum]